VVRPQPKPSKSQASKAQATAQAFTGRRLQRLGPALEAPSTSELPFESQGPSSFSPLVQLGAASGLKGQLRASPLQQSIVINAQSGELISAAGPLVLAASKRCWVKTPRQKWLVCKSLAFSPGLKFLLANQGALPRLRISLDICQHRSQAEELQHSELGLETSELEVHSKSFWRVFSWIHWQAFCPKGKSLGYVQEVLTSRFQAVLRLGPTIELLSDSSKTPDSAGALVPVVPRYVLKVLPDDRRLVLDWTP